MAAVQKNAATAVLAVAGRYVLVALLLAVVVASRSLRRRRRP